MKLNKETKAYHGVGLRIKVLRMDGRQDHLVVVASSMAALKAVYRRLSYTGELDEKRTRKVKVMDDADTKL